MGCCLVVGILAASPRLILFGLWLFTDYLAQASIAFVWGFIGFLFVPCTTMAYAIAAELLRRADGLGHRGLRRGHHPRRLHLLRWRPFAHARRAGLIPKAEGRRRSVGRAQSCRGQSRGGAAGGGDAPAAGAAARAGAGRSRQTSFTKSTHTEATRPRPADAQQRAVTPKACARGPATASPAGQSASDAIQSQAVTRPRASPWILVWRVVFHTATRRPTPMPRTP